jgi:shikimate dehydrogenase
LNADVKASTRVYGVVGYPVAHSLSPRMHNAALRAEAIDGVYVAFPVEPGHLHRALEGLAAAGVGGVNVTVPHKEEAAKLCTVWTPEARRAGAVNTIRFGANGIHGHNTDGLGFVRAAEHLIGGVSGKQVLVLGSGGAGRGIASALSAAGASVTVANRTPEKAAALARDLHLLDDAVVDWDPHHLVAAAARADLVVNASSAGMGNKGAVPLDFQKLKSLVPAMPAVADLVYHPLRTFFLEQAAAAGCQTQDGLVMLASQGELSFEFWHGRPAPQGVMEKTLRIMLA